MKASREGTCKSVQARGTRTRGRRRVEDGFVNVAKSVSFLQPRRNLDVPIEGILARDVSPQRVWVGLHRRHPRCSPGLVPSPEKKGQARGARCARGGQLDSVSWAGGSVSSLFARWQ